MNWRHKALALRIFSGIPFGEDLHYFVQRNISRTLPRSIAQFEGMIHTAEELLGAYQQWRGAPDLSACQFLEFGAGRDLVNPISLASQGVGKIVAIDIKPLAKLDLVAHSAHYIARHYGRSCSRCDSWDDLEKNYGVRYLAPAALEDFDDQSFDTVVSKDTLEHIPAAKIESLMREIRRVLKPDGLAIMKIDYGDHYYRFDRSITRFNFLKFSNAEWKTYNSSFHYQNRLRHSEYLTLFRSAGFDIIEERVERCTPVEEVSTSLADRFKPFSLQDLFTLNAIIVARPISQQSRG